MNKPTGPIGVLATGTPLSNAIGELHTLVRMADPDLLRDIDAETFDAWASMYGRMVERMEMTTDGKGFKSVERFASFHNVPAMVRQLWYPLVDYKSAEDLGLELPLIKGGEPELMLVPATADQLQRMQELGERYEAFRKGGVDKSIDNPLAINNDARVIALDSRLIDAGAEPSSKLAALADRIVAKHEETKNNRYTYSATDKRPHPVPGALQFVFLNNGTPGGNNRGNFNAYQELKDLLVARGMPADKIAFIHDAARADQRIKLQRDANHGGINVLVGSTMRMGKGLNAQNRAVSLYHVDPDWRPSDMAQRDGRIVRNGNQNEEVEIVWMATEGTFDSRMYGLLATKAKGFNQLYKARVDDTSDEIMEVEDANLPYEEAMAIISGNPYLIEQEELRKELRTLELDQRNRATQRAILGKRLNELRIDIENLSNDIPRRARALPLLEPVLGDDFRITLAGTQYTKHKDAAAPLMQLLTGVGQSLPAGRATTPDAKLGRLGGLDVVAVAYREDSGETYVRLHLDGLPGIVQRSTLAELAELKGETVLRRLVKTITEAPERQTEDEGNLNAKRTTRDQLLIDRERLRGQVPGLGRVRERKSLVDTLVAAQASLNKIGKPNDDEPASVTTSRREATARRDDLQQRLDRLAAEPPPSRPPPRRARSCATWTTPPPARPGHLHPRAA
ncbi:helicase-related protein [Streptomyces stramineus]